MNAETLEKANALQNEISGIRRLLIKVKQVLEGIGDNRNCFDSVTLSHMAADERLDHYYLGDSKAEIYIKSLPDKVWRESLSIIEKALEDKIKGLELEFNSLK